jgi:hypothetical protein
VLGYCLHGENYVFAQTDQTASKLQLANSAVGQAFNAVFNAEKAGGNVARLLVKLNTAGELLANAQNAYNSGNTANVISMVENVTQLAEQINGEAINLRNKSVIESQNSFLLTLIFSTVGAVVFGVSLLYGWRRFRRSFMKKLLGLKPEVVENTV